MEKKMLCKYKQDKKSGDLSFLQEIYIILMMHYSHLYLRNKVMFELNIKETQDNVFLFHMWYSITKRGINEL